MAVSWTRAPVAASFAATRALPAACASSVTVRRAVPSCSTVSSWLVGAQLASITSDAAVIPWRMDMVFIECLLARLLSQPTCHGRRRAASGVVAPVCRILDPAPATVNTAGIAPEWDIPVARRWDGDSGVAHLIRGGRGDNGGHPPP